MSDFHNHDIIRLGLIIFCRQIVGEVLCQLLAVLLQMWRVEDEEHDGDKEEDAEPAAPGNSIINEATDEGYGDEKAQQGASCQSDAPPRTALPQSVGFVAVAFGTQ